MNRTPVSVNMLEAVSAQSELLSLVKEIVPGIAQDVLGRHVKAIHNFWGAWRYRSVLLTFDDAKDDKRSGFHPYGWFLYYNRPEVLVFARKNTSQQEWDEMDAINLTDEFYFALVDSEKRKVLEAFVFRALNKIKIDVENA
jgi:hypothetical protein